MTNRFEQEAISVADSFGPALFTEGKTLVVIICDEDGFYYCFRGSKVAGLKALEEVFKDASANIDGFQSYDPPRA